MKEAIKQEIACFVRNYREEKNTETAWKRPLVGFCSASDGMFHQLKSAVSPAHAMPDDLLANAKTVIAFFLPFTEETATGNIQNRHSSWEWAKAYVETNALIHDISMHMKAFLETHGHDTATIPATHNFDPQKLISNWSHRHVAFIAGLGKFGLNHMLITARGCCGRIGTFVTSVVARPDPRPDEEACLYRQNGKCMRCVERCVNQALFEKKFLRFRCHEMCLRNNERFPSLGRADVCGKCLVGVPCSHRNPVKNKEKNL